MNTEQSHVTLYSIALPLKQMKLTLGYWTFSLCQLGALSFKSWGYMTADIYTFSGMAVNHMHGGKESGRSPPDTTKIIMSGENPTLATAS